MRTVAAVIAVAAVASSLAEAGVGAPSLRVVSIKPVTVTGARFAPRATLRVTVQADGRRRARTIRAAADGSFRTVFPALVPRDPCAVTATATGPGIRVVWKVSERMCAADGGSTPTP